MLPRTIFIFKAQPIADHIPPHVIIDIYGKLPPVKTLEEGAQLFDKEAKTLEEALYAALPGGTYDQLTSRMLQRKASHFRVSYSPEETTDAS